LPEYEFKLNEWVKLALAENGGCCELIIYGLSTFILIISEEVSSYFLSWTTVANGCLKAISLALKWFCEPSKDVATFAIEWLNDARLDRLATTVDVPTSLDKWLTGALNVLIAAVSLDAAHETRYTNQSWARSSLLTILQKLSEVWLALHPHEISSRARNRKNESSVVPHAPRSKFFGKIAPEQPWVGRTNQMGRANKKGRHQHDLGWRRKIEPSKNAEQWFHWSRRRIRRCENAKATFEVDAKF
jgi:hypothetical protein